MAKRYDQYEVKAMSRTVSYGAASNASEDVTSSPLISNVSESSASLANQENLSPSKHERRKSRVISGAELSPLKILNRKRSSPDNLSEGSMGPPPLRCARRLSPEKRFPVKASGSYEEEVRNISLEEMVQDNEGLKHAIDIFEDEVEQHEGNLGGEAKESDGDEAAGPDDTMISTFSAFSAVPGMTMYSRLGQSPTKLSALGGATPRGRPDPSPVRGSRPPTREDGSNHTANLLMDFMESSRFPQRSPDKKGSLSPSRTTPKLEGTPNRTHTNLIDFDIPPMPTPRSVPTITPRELESLKSGFLSEISSLKASLSGKEAEVQSLKSAVGDAEKRVGESMEQLREESALKEQLKAEKDDWENRGREMENVLRQVKDEIATSRSDREELEQKLDESEKRREAAEMMHQEAESKIAGMRAGKECGGASPDGNKSSASNKDVELAVERVARELHTLYKGKHETKVAALKKSYESRWEKKVRDLEARIEQLQQENKEFQNGRRSEASSHKADIGDVEARKQQAVRDSATIKELTATVQRLEAVVTSVQKDSDELRINLEKERVEKGELVQLAEEMMSMQSFVAPSQRSAPTPARDLGREPAPTKTPAKTPAKTPRRSVDSYSYNRSAGRASGLRAPGSALRQPGSRISAPVLPRPGGGQRNSIMSNIERMGSHRGRGQE